MKTQRQSRESNVWRDIWIIPNYFISEFYEPSLEGGEPINPKNGIQPEEIDLSKSNVEKSSLRLLIYQP